MTFCRGSSSSARTPSSASCLAGANSSSLSWARRRASACNVNASARLLDSSAAPTERWELPIESDRCRPNPSSASPNSRLLRVPAPRKIQSEMTLAAPQAPSGIKAAPAGRKKSNATDSTPPMGSPSSTMPLLNMCLSVFCSMHYPQAFTKERGFYSQAPALSTPHPNLRSNTTSV